MDAQMKRGFLEACVLAVLSRGESYGYQIIKEVPPTLGLTESTLYPLLKRLEGAGCIAVRSAEHNGRLRKYYRITKPGRARVAAFIEEWNEVEAIYRFVSDATAKKVEPREEAPSKKKTVKMSPLNDQGVKSATSSRQTCKIEGAAL